METKKDPLKSTAAEANVTIYRHADGTCHLFNARPEDKATSPAQAVATLCCPVDEIEAVLAKFEYLCCANKADKAAYKEAHKAA